MTALRKPALAPLNQNEQFLIDTCDFFSGRRAGHMGKWMYSYPQSPDDPVRGAEFWAKVVEDAKNGSPYYVFNDERSVIREAAPVIASYITDDCTLIDLGPGSKDAFENKVGVVIRACAPNIKEYIGVDIAPSILEVATDACQNFCAEVVTKKIEADFFEDKFQYSSTQPSELAVFFGLTLFNLCIDPHVEDLPQLLLTSYLKRLKDHFKTDNGILVITQDTNQNIESLIQAYETNRAFESTVIDRIMRDLPVSSGYSPANFKHEMEWIEETQTFSKYFSAQCDMDFSIGSEAFQITKGDKFYFHNCFKLKSETFMAAARDAGYKELDTISKQDGRCVLHILKA